MRHLGIDLGTTNSAAALFDGDTVSLVRNAEGGTFTPSVVRIDGRGRFSVGARALAQADADPDNTRGEFKRLMGTGGSLSFPACGRALPPEALAAEVLKSLRQDVSDVYGFMPARAVIAVPALFELPQASATSEAARLAGFEQVELLQEPVASALAAGWTAQDDGGGAWLVYDLGGGTFDVSLVETRDGILRVVGHDGDNFLGGRDIDLLLVQWAVEQLASQGVVIDRADPGHSRGLRRLRRACEVAKIDLSRREAVDLMLAELFEVGGRSVDVDLTLDRAVLEPRVLPIVDRSIAVCRRLLAQHGLTGAELRKVVLVGGPTVIPSLRERLSAALCVPFADGLDPMSLVARGAALYAGSAGLDAEASEAAPVRQGRGLWMQFPAMTGDTTPFVAGRVLGGAGPVPTHLRVLRDDFVREEAEGANAVDFTEIGADGGFVVMVELAPRRANRFVVEAWAFADGVGSKGVAVAVVPAEFTIVHGLSLGEPPLSRSVGVALVDDMVCVYLPKGTPLPAKRTFLHKTVDTASPGDANALAIPIVQGEVPFAHLCRLVGKLVIEGKALTGTLPAGSEVEVTLEVDRGGQLSAYALVPALDLRFDQVAHLRIPDADPVALDSHLHILRDRLAQARYRAPPEHADRLVDVEWTLQDAAGALAVAHTGDADAAQRSHRLLLDAEAALDQVEDALAWPELNERAVRMLAWASQWVTQLGTPQEQRMLTETSAAVERARTRRSAADLERHLGVARQLKNAAYYRHPDAWKWDFDAARSDVNRATDLVRAQALVAEGRRALDADDRDALRRVVQDLWKLLPQDPRDRALGYGSGVR